MPDAERAKAALLATGGEPAAGAAEAFLRRSALRAGLAVVYHGLAERPGDPARDLVPAHGVDLFERQLEHLCSRYRPVRASRLAAAARTRRRGEPFPVAITFDDDLPSHTELALALLGRAGAPATFFLGGRAGWADRLQALLERGAEPPPPVRAGMSAREARAAVEALPAAERERFELELAEAAREFATGAAAVDAGRLAEAGHEVGFHTLAHRVLPPLPDDELAAELSDGRDELAAAAGAPIDAIAYPFGVADERVAAAARSAGYRAGFIVGPAAVTPATDPLLVPRVDAPFEPPARLAWHLARALLAALAAGGESGSRGADARRAIAGESLGRALRRARTEPRAGSLDLGDLATTRPVSGGFGFERGTPVDRHYIDRFLGAHAADVRGRVLEVSEDRYTRSFGGAAVESVEVLHVEEGNPRATLVGDLTDAPQIPDASFDCVICTQTLLLIWDVRAAIATIRRILRPGGVALVTVPGITRVCREEAESWGDYWRFTAQSARRLHEEAFGAGAVDVSTYGNVLTATAQLHGIAAEELPAEQLDAHDRDYEVLIGVRAEARPV
ncbi:MAG TPA: polysaccharide deacetylase family protein [Thermoleophilaceae bacterium]|jgi:peptidoglycan/xylan/chitin deacetylase (PgdA/CDA1 family)/SAM-dependent methyltransferase